MSHKKRNKPVGGKEGVVFDRPVPKFLQSYLQPPTDQVDISAKWERNVEQVKVEEEISNLRKQGFQIESDSSNSHIANSSSSAVEQSDKGKESEKNQPTETCATPGKSLALSISRGSNQTIASVGIKKKPTSTLKNVSQKDIQKQSSHHKQTKVIDRQRLSFQEQDD